MLGRTVSEAEGNIANMKALERNVADNLRWREMGRDIERMKGEIRELEREGAEIEVEKYQEQAEKLRKAHNKWTAEVNPLTPITLLFFNYSKVIWWFCLFSFPGFLRV